MSQRLFPCVGRQQIAGKSQMARPLLMGAVVHVVMGELADGRVLGGETATSRPEAGRV